VVKCERRGGRALGGQAALGSSEQAHVVWKSLMIMVMKLLLLKMMDRMMMIVMMMIMIMNR